MNNQFKQWLVRYQTDLVVAVMTGVFVLGGLWLLKKMTDMPTSDVWDTDFSHALALQSEFIPMAERDAIAPIDAPVWNTVNQVTWLGDKSPVIVLHIAKPARAYPLVILLNHGIVNDMVEQTPIVVTFCQLCNSPTIYNRVVNGQTLRFGTTGTIRNSGLIMWDDVTQSWWQQFTGEALVGAYTGMMLTVIPSQVVGWQTFKDHYPDGIVLVGDENMPAMSYGRNPYIGYDSNPQPFMYMDELDERLFPTERVLAGLIDGQPMAYPFSRLVSARVINDQVGNSPVVAFWQAGANSAQDMADIDESHDVGMVALFSRMVGDTTLTFRYENAQIRDNETDSVWNIFGESVAGEMRGAILMQYNACPYFWFSWVANYPQTLVYDPDMP